MQIHVLELWGENLTDVLSATTEHALLYDSRQKRQQFVRSHLILYEQCGRQTHFGRAEARHRPRRFPSTRSRKLGLNRDIAAQLQHLR